MLDEAESILPRIALSIVCVSEVHDGCHIFCRISYNVAQMTFSVRIDRFNFVWIFSESKK